MKKTLSLILVLVLIFGLLNTSAFADNNPAIESDKTEVEAIVETYLRECAKAIFLFEDSNLSRNTLDGVAFVLSNEDVTNLQEKVQDFSAFREANSPELMQSIKYTPATLTDFQDNLELQNARVEYLRHINEIQNITYDYFNTSYTFFETVVDGDYAVTSVSEELDYQYSFYDRPTYEQYTYNISLAKISGQWTILEVTSDDPFFLGNYATGFDLETEIRDLDVAMASADAETAAAPVDVLDTAGLQSTRDVAYIKQNAINYALTYSTKSDDDTNYKPGWANSNMPWFSANCMNFVSQCFWAGLGGSNSPTDISSFYAMDNVGSTESHKWYASKSSSVGSWRSCSAFKTYVDNPVAGEKDLICTTKEIASNSNSLYFSANLLKGAAIQTKGLDGNGNYVALGHVVFISNATGNTRDQVFLTSYNTNWKDKVFSSRYPVTSKEQAIDRLYIIIPSYMRNADTGLRLWADLCNALPSGTSVPIKGYANAQCKNITVQIYNTSGALVSTKNFSNTSTVSTNYTCSGVGAWRIVLTGTDSLNNTKSFTYIVRTY